MDDKKFELLLKSLLSFTKVILSFVVLLAVASVYLIKFYDPRDFEQSNKLADISAIAESEISEEGIHVNSGLIADINFELVVSNCTGCHSSKLIVQNRATQEGWRNMIKWMQETQNLWELGANEDKIVAYLAKNYAPDKQGRRANLENIEWYELEEER